MADKPATGLDPLAGGLGTYEDGADGLGDPDPPPEAALHVREALRHQSRRHL